jgi:hypothetical protein
MTPADSDSNPVAAAGGGNWVPGVTAAIAILAIVWMGLGWEALRRPDTYRGKKGDYYSLLVHGFRSGHLYMDLAADPRLESKDPAIRSQAFAPLDTSYFRGHLYLSYGVTPAALVLLPYACLTGGDLDPRVAVVGFVVLGFLFSLGTWSMAARDAFGRPSALFQAASVAALAFATSTPLLLARAMFYELAEAAVYACTMAACYWIYRALSGRGRPGLQLALASGALALAVGSRPDVVVALPVLAAASLLAASRARKPGDCPAVYASLCAASIVPASLVGALLATYNLERFGSPFDFGFTHSLNAFFSDPGLKLASPRFIWPNLHWYYLTLPAIGPYFPYVYPCRAEFGPAGYRTGEIMHGQFPVFVFAAFVVLSAAFVCRRLLPARPAPFFGILAFIFLSTLLALCPLGIRADRYMVDFQAPLILGIVLLAGLVAPLLGDRFRGPWGAAFAVLVAVAVAFNFFAGIEEFDAFKNIRTSTFDRMEYVGNLPSALLGRLGLLRYGPLEVKAVFPKPEAAPTFEPLLTLGTPRLNDTLYVIEYPTGQIQLLADHLGYPQPRSDLIPIEPGRPYTFSVDMGALYPPLNHPFFSRYGTMQARLLKSRVSVMMDGRLVFNSHLGSYDAPPWTLEIGREDISMSLSRPRFSGTIVSVRRLPPPPQSGALEKPGAWRIVCVLPLQLPGASFPIVASGTTGNGTILFVTILPGNRVRFGIDEWFIGGAASDPIEVDPLLEHTVDVFFGPIARKSSWLGVYASAPEQLAGSGRLLNVWLDGRLVLSAGLKRPYTGPSDSNAVIASNPQGFSTCREKFFGPIQAAPFSELELADFLRCNLALNP